MLIPREVEVFKTRFDDRLERFDRELRSLQFAMAERGNLQHEYPDIAARVIHAAVTEMSDLVVGIKRAFVAGRLDADLAEFR